MAFTIVMGYPTKDAKLPESQSTHTVLTIVDLNGISTNIENKHILDL